jgi:hypothetical protein
MEKRASFINTYTYTQKRTGNNLIMKILDKLHYLAKLHGKRRGKRPIE